MEEKLDDKRQIKFQSAQERRERAAEIRRETSENVLPFGIDFLDRALDGIRKNDVVLVGAPTGAGKTELVTHIAGYNANRGKNVAFFPLEAEECEIENRIIFKLAAGYYFERNGTGGPDVNRVCYRYFLLNKLSPDFESYTKRAEAAFDRNFNSLRIIYRKHEFTIKDLQKYLMLLKSDTDLIIIDHLNYFDFDDQNENKAVGDIVKKIRDLALQSGIPIILVAHIKKQEKRYKSLVPEIEEFHGTSNISKIATKALLLAPDTSEPMEAGKYHTYFRVAKYRIDGSVSRYIGRCSFNIEKNKYDKEFKVGHLSEDGRSFVPIKEHAMLPIWAR